VLSGTIGEKVGFIDFTGVEYYGLVDVFGGQI